MASISPPSVNNENYDPKKPDKVTCTLCDTEVSGGIKWLKQHLAGGYGDAKMCPKTTTVIRKEMRDYLESNKRRRPLFNEEGDEPPEEPADVVVATAASNTKAKLKVNKSIVEMLRKTPEELVDERHKGCSQPTIPARIRTKEEKHYVDQQWALWFYECGYKPPTPYMLGEPLLKDAVKLTNSMREEHEQAWKMYGCTLMSDGWTDKRGRHLINFPVNSPAGTYFLESVDASSEVHDAFMLADLLEAKIEEIGKDKMVQVITDNGANYKAAGRILMERISTLYWSPCAAHCLDLMLEEIGNLKEFKKPIARAKPTRFATSFLTLKSLHKHIDALKALFVSEEWLGNKLAKTAAGQEVHNIVLSMEFWNSVEDCLRASAPLLIVLRVVDGDERPAMPEVTALMNHAKEKIKLSFATENKKTLLKNIIKITEKRWVTQMDHPLYGAVLYLNPGRLHSLIQANDDATVGQLRGRFLDVLGRMVEDEEIRSKIDAQSLDYEGLRGDAFSNKLAKQNLQNLNPLDWWRSYGGRAIELQRFARRIMHIKKRNRLLHKRLNDIVFVSYNRKMKTRFQLRHEKKGKIFDPLVIEEFDWDNEWADSSYVHPQGARGYDNGDNGNGLTWELVDEVVGASSSLRGRNLPRNASSKRARNGQSRLTELEEDLGLANEEEEEEDPHDDADVSDCEQDPNGSNGGGENMEGPNILDEFDDGY
ncbi:unnamed protein product [Miscanthus lutarioriparius]|uniref:DUF659 domain-containing protein n=1 Tax=Miscanthus lutarioriparius TaxID=422564 RepID=A0A811MYT5_9POAL|nr:unnamed protein product [Miscanthus lutarioriparius]